MCKCGDPSSVSEPPCLPIMTVCVAMFRQTIGRLMCKIFVQWAWHDGGIDTVVSERRATSAPAPHVLCSPRGRARAGTRPAWCCRKTSSSWPRSAQTGARARSGLPQRDAGEDHEPHAPRTRADAHP